MYIEFAIMFGRWIHVISFRSGCISSSREELCPYKNIRQN